MREFAEIIFRNTE